LAATEKQQKGDDPDFTVGVLCRKVGAAYYFLDCVAVQESPAEVEQLMLRTSRSDAERSRRDHCGYRLRWELEPGSASIREAARLAGLFSGLDARAVTPREHGATGGKWDKIARATGLAAQARAGNVFVCPAAWSATDQSLPVDEFLAEMHGFPDRPHDDVPDAASAAYNCLPNFLNQGSAEFVVGPQVMPAAWQNW
jgi:predicted phage terminase large subunit-like protein